MFDVSLAGAAYPRVKGGLWLPPAVGLTDGLTDEGRDVRLAPRGARLDAAYPLGLERLEVLNVGVDGEPQARRRGGGGTLNRFSALSGVTAVTPRERA